MEVKLDKRFALDGVTLEQAWALLSDIRATAACMPGAQITEQLDGTHYKGTVKSKVGPAQMMFHGDIEVLGLDPEACQLRLLGKGADKSGSAATMQLTAQLEAAEVPDSTVLIGQATIVVSGKLAQFGSRLLVPVSDALLQQFAGHFRSAAAAMAMPAAVLPVPPGTPGPTQAQTADPSQPTPAPSPAAAPGSQVKALNPLALAWLVLKGWLAGLFHKKPR